MSVIRKMILFLLLVLLFVVIPFGASATSIPPTSPTPVPSLARLVQPIRVLPVVTTQAPAVTLVLDSVPAGAQVTIDGIVVGRTPYASGTLSAGSHTLVLSMTGYADYPATFTISPALQTRLSYTLNALPTVPVTVPVSSVTTPILRVPVTPLKTITPFTPALPPSPVLPQGNLSTIMKFPVPVSINPVVIRVGNHTFSPHLTTLSPYFSYQFSAPAAAGTNPWHVPDVLTTPTSYIEVDTLNVYLPGSHVMSSAEMALDPVWGQEDSVPITTDAKFFNNTNFRWISAESGVTGLYQVSRFPFDSNASRWQNQYVPGLVESGPVKDLHVDSDGFHYFSLNFAPVANHKFGDPPLYTGVAKIDETVPGRGMTMGSFQIPGTEIGIYTKKAKIGPVSVPYPAAIGTIPSGAMTEARLGNPNENTIISTSASFSGAGASALESALQDMPQTYYVRVVPIRHDGSAGIPTMPVTVTVVRPKPCPPTPPANSVNYVEAKPPSAEIASFYMTSFVPDWIHTDQDGKLVSRAYFVTVAKPPYCDAPSQQQDPMFGQLNSQLCSFYGGGQAGYHFYADPKENHWYDTVWDIVVGLFGAFTQVIHAVSAAWTGIQNVVVEIAAVAVQGLTFGQFDCSGSAACKAVLQTGLSIAESSLGIPPTIPDVSDLENMGSDYVAKVAAEELGAGGVLDTAQGVYNTIPDSAKDTIKNNADQVGQDLGSSLASGTAGSIATAAGNWYIPDPLYYQAHPATINVKVSNPNSVPTDPVYLSVTDSGGLYKQMNSIYVPALRAHDSTVIPVVLVEDYSKVYTTGCTADAYTTECGDVCIPCYWKLWQFRALDVSRSGGDTFTVGFSETKNGFYLGSLTPSSNGKVLADNTIISFDEQGQTCGSYNAKSVLKYPDTWQLDSGTLNQNLENLMWLKYQFTEGDHGKMIGNT